MAIEWFKKASTPELLADDKTLSSILQVGIKPGVDLAPHGSTIPSLTEPAQSDGDSFYVFSYLTSGAHKFTVLFDLLLLHPFQADAPQLSLLAMSLLDETNVPAQYFSTEVPDLTFTRTSVAKEGLNIQVFSSDKRDGTLGTLLGTDAGIQITGSAVGANGETEFTLALNMTAIGPTLPDLANGVIPFPGNTLNFEYALPQMHTTGRLVVNGASYEVTGNSWLDREWGHFGEAKWTWMGIDLDDVFISLWDQQRYEPSPNTYVGGQAFATTLDKQTGSITLSTVRITEDHLTDDKKGGGRYPNSWTVTLPGQCPLKVTAVRAVPMNGPAVPTEQAISSTMIPRLEAKCRVSGTTQGNSTLSGVAFVEVGVIPSVSGPST
jgi:hypothetical protein